MVIALAAIPRPNKMIASLIINPADGKPIDEELLALAFADEIKQAQAKYDLLCSQTIVSRMKAGSDAMVALWARNKFGCDRPGQTIDFPGARPERRHRRRQQDHHRAGESAKAGGLKPHLPKDGSEYCR